MEEEDELFLEHPRFKVELSNLGRVRQNYNQSGKKRITNGSRIRRAGYRETFERATKVINKETGKKHQKRVHQLVLEAFGCEKYEDKVMVDHIDGNPENNAIWNLRWVNYMENNNNRK